MHRDSLPIFWRYINDLLALQVDQSASCFCTNRSKFRQAEQRERYRLYELAIRGAMSVSGKALGVTSKSSHSVDCQLLRIQFMNEIN